MSRSKRIVSIVLIIMILLSLVPIQNRAQAAVVDVADVSVPSYSGGTSSNWMIYDGGMGTALGRTGGQSKMRIVTGTTQAQFDAYCTLLAASGYSNLSSNSVAAKSGVNKYAKYLASDATHSIYTYFVPAYGKTFIIVDTHIDSLRKFTYNSNGMQGGRTELYMYAISASDDGYGYDSEWGSQNRGNAGAMFIIKMSDNSLFVVDGGYYNQLGDRDSEKLYAFMREITGIPEGQKIYINTWFISHLHTDHYAGFARFLHKYSDKLELQNIMYNFDIEGSSQKYIRRAINLFPNAKYYKQHTGETFNIAGVQFDVLYTVEDRYTPTADKKLLLNDAACIGEYTEENNGSTVLRVTFEGKTFLLTGDIEKAENVLMAMYPDTALKADVMQIPHHGFDYHTEFVQLVAPTVSFVNQSETAANNRSTIYRRIKALEPYAGTLYFGGTETVGYCAQSGVFYCEESTPVDWLNWSARSYELEEENYYDGTESVLDTETYYRYTRVTEAPDLIDGTFAIVDDKLGVALSYNTASGALGDESPMLVSNDTLYFGSGQRRNVNWRITAEPASKTSSLIVASGGKGYYINTKIWKDSGNYWGSNTHNAMMALGQDNTYPQTESFFDKWQILTDDMDASCNNARIDMYRDNTFLIYSRYDASGYHPLFRDPYMTQSAGTGWGTSAVTKETYAEYMDYTALRLYAYQTTPEQMSLRWTGHKDYYATTGIPKNDMISLLSADIRVYFDFAASGNSGEIFYDGYQQKKPGTYYFSFIGDYDPSAAKDYAVNIFYVNSSGASTMVGSFTLHVEDRNNNADSKSLFFDFNDDPISRRKYKNMSQYSEINFDSTDRWQFIEYYQTNQDTKGYVDTLSGTMKIYTKTAEDVSRSMSVYAYGEDNTPLNYDPKDAEIVQIRYKMDNLKASGTSNPYFRLWYRMSDGTTETYTYDNKQNLGTNFVSDGEYRTITMDLYTLDEIKALSSGSDMPTQTFNSCKTIVGIRPAFHLLTTMDVTKPGVITIDYIYIGPRDGAPQEKTNELLFDFDNHVLAQERYSDEQYNAINFDREALPNWATSETSTTEKVYDDCYIVNDEGVIVVTVAEGLAFDTNNSYCGPWISTAGSPGNHIYVSRYDTEYHALGYEPEQGDFITVRFKVDGCVAVEGASPEVVVIFDYMIDGTTDRGAYTLKKNFTLQNGQYLTMTFPANEQFYTADVITNVGFRFRNIKAESLGSGTVTVDYIYVGQEEVLMHDVKFCAQDGAVLQTVTVNHGAAATFTAQTPTKEFDKDNHYTFAGWLDAAGRTMDISRIGGNLTLYPVFTAQKHELTPSAQSDNVLVCACGYSTISQTEADCIDVVIDYAKPIDIEVRNRVFAAAVTKAMLADAPMRAEFADPDDAIYGDFELLDTDNDGTADALRFAPKNFFSKIVTVNCIFTVCFDTLQTERDITVPVRIIPATSVYYETDFSDEAIELHTFGSTDQKYLWSTVGTAQNEQQDADDSKDKIYDFVLDRGGKIPAGAFFADFTNDAAAQLRYETHYTYIKNNEIDTCVNYDLTGSWSHNSSYQADETIDTVEGTLNFKMLNNNRDGAYIQASTGMTSGYWLNYHPEKDHYFQIRFKMKNAIGTLSDGTGLFSLKYYILGNNHEGKGEGTGDFLYTAGETAIPAEYFTNGEYVTLTFALDKLDAKHNKMSAIRLTFLNVRSKSDTELAEFTIDYVYCGPDAAKSDPSTVPAINPTTTYAPYLFFNFNNDSYSDKRYADDIYLLNEYDTANAAQKNWVCATGDPTKTTAATAANKTLACSKGSGVLQASIGGMRTDSNNSTYVSATMTTADFPWTTGDTNKNDYAFNFQIDTTIFDKNPDLKYYGIVRFRFTNVKEVGDAKVQFSLLDGSATTDGHKYKASDPYEFKNGTMIVVSVDLTSAIKSLKGSIKSFYVRFVDVLSNVKNEYGTVEIDYIYIGPEANAAAAVYYNMSTEPNLYMDFRNTNFDKERYMATSYCAHNYDVASTWVTQNLKCTMDTNNGIMKLEPTADYSKTAANYSGRIEANNDSTVSATAYNTILGYHMTGKDYIVIRMRHTGLQNYGTPTMQITYGSGERSGRPGDVFDGKAIPIEQCNAALKVENNNKWVTYIFDISAYKSKMNSWLSFFHIDFITAKLSSIEIDYIYIGELLNAGPPEDALYYGFDNTAADRNRYASASYANVNYDTAGATKFTLTNLESGVVDPVNGTLTLTTDNKNISTFAIATTGKINFHTKGKALQIRFKMEDVVLAEDVAQPYFRLQFGDSNTDAFSSIFYDAKYLSDGRYVTLTVDLTEKNAAAFYNTNAATKLRFYFGGMKNAENKQGKIIIDYIYIGPKDGMFKTDLTYGYDSSYLTDGQYSNGSSYFAEGLGIPEFNTDYSINTEKTGAYTEGSFTFTGSGFDIVSRTGEEQGLVRVMIYDTQGNFVKSAQVLNKSDKKTETYQVPVLSVKMDAYGTYTARVYVAAAFDFSTADNGAPDGDQDIFNGALDRGGQFYFDAVRIYNTIDVASDTEEADIAYKAYLKHGEADQVFKELREFVLDPNGYTPVGSTEAVLYYEPGKDMNGNVIEAYDVVSPNNEVYLNPGKAIAFKLEVEGEIPASIDIGAKCIDGTATSMLLGIGKNAPNALPTGDAIAIESAATQYYALKLEKTDWVSDGDKHSIFITIYNNSASGKLSVTNVKYAYDVAPAAEAAAVRTVRFIVDAQMLKKLTTPCEHAWDNGTITCEATCSRVGERIYACANCDETKTEEIALLAHNYENGVCICGAEASAQPEYVFDESLALSMNISVGAEMQVVYTVNAKKVSSFKSFYLVVSKNVAGGEPIITTYGEGMSKFDVITNERNTILGYQAFFTGINAKEMGDAFTATLYAVAADGTIHYGRAVVDSIKSFLMSKLESETSSDVLKTLAVDMLNYGAAAQRYFCYDVENPVNADLSEAQKLLGTQSAPNAFDYSEMSGEGLDFTTDVTVQSKVCLVLQCAYKTLDATNVVFVIKDAKTGEILAEGAPTLFVENKAVQFKYDEVGAKQMRDLITLELYDNGRPVSKTLTWSVESYVAATLAEKPSQELADMVNAMLIYGDCAARYLALNDE